MKNVFAILPTGFGKSSIFQPFPRMMLSTSDASNEFKTRALSTIIVVCLPLEPIVKDQVEQLNIIAVEATALGIGEEAGKYGKCEIVGKYGS